MTQWLKLFYVATLFLRMALPALSLPDYTCDDVYGSMCFMKDINDLTAWNFRTEYIYNGQIQEIKFTGDFSELTSPISINSDQYSYNAITTIDLSGNHLNILTKFHFSINPLLVANLSRNEIENLDSDSIFKDHPLLETIDLSFNRIASINATTFNGLSRLRTLDLHDNQLIEIGEFVFAPLDQLKHLDLTSNYIERFENNSFGALDSLETLKLQLNNFSEFDFNILESNSNLRDISLGDNRGSGFVSLVGMINSTTSVRFSKIIQSNATAYGRWMYIKDSQVSELRILNTVENVVATNSTLTKLIFSDNASSLMVADFSRNLLTGHLSLENCQTLEVLDLSFNQLENVRFGNESLMTSLNLSQNNFTLIPNITTLTKLIILDVSFNCIENFEVSTFSHMISLEVLNLRQTCFKALQYGTFTFQTELRVLDISFNNLLTINLDVLSAQSNLEDLLIDGNNLTNIESIDSIGNHLHNLQSMGLTHNNWSCKTLISLVNKLSRSKVRLFVEESIKHTTNVKGIGCTTSNSSQETLIVPEMPVLINHTMYMRKIEKINEIVRNVNELKDRQIYRENLANAIKDLQHEKVVMKGSLDDRINQFKTFGKEIVNKFELINEINFKKLLQMKVAIERLNGTNNEKYALMVESIKSLKNKLKLIRLDDKEYAENKIARNEIKGNSEYYDDLGTLKTLEICSIVLMFVLIIVALYYAVVYC